MKVFELGNERCLGPIPILQQPLKSRHHIPRLMENQAKVFERRRHWQELALNMLCELIVQRLPMKDDHFSFGGSNDQAHVEAELMHTIQQVLQSMRCPGKEYDIFGIHQ